MTTPDPTPHPRTAFRQSLRKAAYDLPSPPAECEAEMRLHDFSDGSMAYLTCDLDRAEHAGLNHHDPTFGIWWNACTLQDHGHADPDNEGRRSRPERTDPDCPECGFGLPRHDKDCATGRNAEYERYAYGKPGIRL